MHRLVYKLLKDYFKNLIANIEKDKHLQFGIILQLFLGSLLKDFSTKYAKMNKFSRELQIYSIFLS